MEKMEALFNVWHSQIEQVLTEHEQIRREADNIGPDVELQYWKNRMDKFHMWVYWLAVEGGTSSVYAIEVSQSVRSKRSVGYLSLSVKHTALAGIEPTTFRLLVRRATICATEITKLLFIINFINIIKFEKIKI